MIDAYEERYYWEEIRYGLEHLIGQLDDYRNEVKSNPFEESPEFDGLEEVLNEATEYIDGRLHELDPSEIVDHVYSIETRRLAQEALSQGINYFGLSELVSEEKERAMEYITSHDMASMNYRKTRKAVRKYREAELNANAERHGRRERVILLSR